jgi:hypothetical protein
VVPPEDGERDFKIIFDDTDKDDIPSAAASPAFVASVGPMVAVPGPRSTDPINALLASPGGAADGPLRGLGPAGTPARVPLAQQQPGAVMPPVPPVTDQTTVTSACRMASTAAWVPPSAKIGRAPWR